MIILLSTEVFINVVLHCSAAEDVELNLRTLGPQNFLALLSGAFFTLAGPYLYFFVPVYARGP
jgi:hypothetical protein